MRFTILLCFFCLLYVINLGYVTIESNPTEILKVDSNTKYKIVNAWGKPGRGDGDFRQPYGSLVFNNNYFIADCINGRIQIFNEDGQFLSSIGERGDEKGELSYPADISIGKFKIDGEKKDAIFVIEERNHRISVFGLDGTSLYTYGEHGKGIGQFNNPLGIEIDSKGFIYVVDYANDRIQKFDENFNFVKTWGTSGQGPGQFKRPYYMTIDKNGDLFIVDRGNDRIQKFNSDGEFLLEFGEKGTEPGQFNYPHEITVDKNNNIYVADFRNNRIQIFDANGAYLSSFGDATTLFGPKTVAVDEKGYVYVSDLFTAVAYITKWSPYEDDLEYKNESFDANNMPDSLSKFKPWKEYNRKKVYSFWHLGYEPKDPLWSSGTKKERALLVQRPRKIEEIDGEFQLPDGSVFFKSFSLNSTKKHRLETRVMFKNNNVWQYYTYVWNSEQTEAIKSPGGESIEVADDLYGSYTYKVPTISQCYNCHMSSDNELLGFTYPQLQHNLKDYHKNRIFSKKINKFNYDSTIELPREHEGLSYLKGNCAFCHNGERTFDLNTKDMTSNIDLASPDSHLPLISSKNPGESMILQVIETGQMPPLGVQVIDTVGIQILRTYISDLISAYGETHQDTLLSIKEKETNSKSHEIELFKIAENLAGLRNGQGINVIQSKSKNQDDKIIVSAGYAMSGAILDSDLNIENKFSLTSRKRLNNALAADAISLKNGKMALTVYRGGVHIIDSQGKFLKAIGEDGNKADQVRSPLGLIELPNENLLVADQNNHRLQEFDQSGNQVKIWPIISDLKKPYGLRLRGDQIYISDKTKNRLIITDLEGEVDTIISEVIFPNGEKTHLKSNQHITFDNEGRLFIADSGNNRIVVLDQSLNGLVVLKHPDFYWIRGIAILSDGSIIVTAMKSDPKINKKAKGGVLKFKAIDWSVLKTKTIKEN